MNNTYRRLSYQAVTGWISAACLTIFFSASALASDLDIYQDGGSNEAVLTLMLDTSGSMLNMDSLCRDTFEEVYGVGAVPSRSTNPTVTKLSRTDPRYERFLKYDFDQLPVATCSLDDSGELLTRRIDDLRMAIWDVLDTISPKYYVGFGVYPINDDPNNNSTTTKNGKAGKIVVPARPLSATQKSEIRSALKNIQANLGTPAANAYAEAAAYMLGRSTTTVTTTNELRATGYVKRRSCFSFRGCRNDVYVCDTNSDRTFQLDGATWTDCGRDTRNQRNVSNSEVRITFPFDVRSEEDLNLLGNGTIWYGVQSQTTNTESLPQSGFPLSVASSKAGATYTSPVVNSVSECGGNGIFFLTDGEPNNSSTSIATTLMNNATGRTNFTCSPSSLTNSNTRDPNSAAWDCMSNLAVDLTNANNSPGTTIYTATSGYGPNFSQLATTFDQVYKDNPKISTRQLISEGLIKLSDCDAATGADARNLCKLGLLGKGGFSYGKDATDVSTAITRFAQDIEPISDKISTGTMSVPVDTLNFVQPLNDVYLPVLDINRTSPIELWPGNLKKYRIIDGTIQADSSDGLTPVFSSRDGEFKKSVWDFWNVLSVNQPDLADPTLGGSRSRILDNPRLDNPDTEVDEAQGPNRFAWINNGGTLSRINVAGTALSGFTTLTDLSNKFKINLLNFLGYAVPTTFGGDTDISDSTTLVVGGQAIPQTNKVLGAVLHSTPQLITYSADISSEGVLENRDDYILYGSMDGALHLVDDQTGKEVFNFVPKEVLKRQGDAFMPNGTFTNDQGIPYGVDAPWVVYSLFANSLDDIQAKQVLTFGGLRMGGSTFYGLDLSDYTDPDLVYQVGSNYADQIDEAGNLKGEVTSLTGGSDTGFERMGQSWGKPAVGFVMNNGVKTLVNFLPGGYDLCYEDPQFELTGSSGSGSLAEGTLCSDKTAAQGNSIYMVGVGTSFKETDTNEERIDLGSTVKGELLWSTSSGLRHSVVSEIRTLDRNYDGLVDHLYFADLGGAVYRVDINNDRNTNFTASDPVKILDASGAIGSTSDAEGNVTSTDTPPRFYERPLVTFTRLDNTQQIVATVTVGSGDRSSPLSVFRAEKNRVYTIIDKDVARADMFTYGSGIPGGTQATTLARAELNTVDLVPGDSLMQLVFNETEASALRVAINSNTTQGWYYVLENFQDETNVEGLKMFNEPDALNRRLNINVFNPNEAVEIDPCEGGVRGATSRQLLCLPYGTCKGLETSSPFQRAGKGIVDSFVVEINDGGQTKYGILDTTCTGDECNRCVGEACQELCANGKCGPSDDPGYREAVLGERDLRPLDWLQLK